MSFHIEGIMGEGAAGPYTYRAGSQWAAVLEATCSQAQAEPSDPSLLQSSFKTKQPRLGVVNQDQDNLLSFQQCAFYYTA